MAGPQPDLPPSPTVTQQQSVPSARAPFQTRAATLHKPLYSYLYLSLLSSQQQPAYSANEDVDILTFKRHLTAALVQFLGLNGAAIASSMDILKVEGRDVWIRTGQEDGRVILAAVGDWLGEDGVIWRVKGRGDWLGGLIARTREGVLWKGD